MQNKTEWSHPVTQLERLAFLQEEEGPAAWFECFSCGGLEHEHYYKENLCNKCQVARQVHLEIVM
jgi:hypothetical protein